MAIKVAGQEVISDSLKITGATGLDLTPISASIADTAVDVFVYDTRKDSDGGAWRKRTQHTSWYNEPLNTSTRGSRKEFPAVAVIVLENYQLTIYDGDDPSLPMWMVFNTSNSSHQSMLVTRYNPSTSNTMTGVYALNGTICTTNAKNLPNSAWGGLHIVSFISEQFTRSTNRGDDQYVGTNRSFLIADRGNNVFNYLWHDGPYYRIASNSANDVAMTVLPNAPIDPATGLPVPTIAVATDGGVSVIKDDGTVVDSATTLGAQQITFDLYDGLYWVRNTTTGILYYASLSDYSSGDGFGDEVGRTTIGTNDIDLLTWLSSGTNMLDANGPYLAHGGAADTGGATSGLALYDFDTSNFPARTNALITSSYNTGWMNGDIKLATLSDTDATNVTGTELVTNGTFDTDVSGWFDRNGGGISWDSAGRANVNINLVGYGGIGQTIATTPNTNYTISAEFSSTSGDCAIVVRNASDTVTLFASVGFRDGVASYTFNSGPVSSVIVYLQADGNSLSFDVDNVSVRLAEEDRSVNGNGLQVFGTVTKTPVATGADLVAYSGFSASNYLYQPHNDDISFGASDDFCIMLWTNASNETGGNNIVDWGNSINDTGRWVIYESGGVYKFYDAGASKASTISSTTNWTLLAFVRQNGILSIYGNGKLNATFTNSTNYDYADCNLYVGTRHTLGDAWEGPIALLRISATAPTAEQIAKIYEDEKVLFQEGAQATLYGSSDAVTALAYDDSTEELHVGTSAGRSVFSGLRRVDNTTDAVGSAISASNGMVAED